MYAHFVQVLHMFIFFIPSTVSSVASSFNMIYSHKTLIICISVFPVIFLPLTFLHHSVFIMIKLFSTQERRQNSGQHSGMRTQGSAFESQYPLATFLSLVLPPSGQKLPKLLPYCPQTGLTMFYALAAVAAIASLILNIFKRDRKHSRDHYRKSKIYSK